MNRRWKKHVCFFSGMKDTLHHVHEVISDEKKLCLISIFKLGTFKTKQKNNMAAKRYMNKSMLIFIYLVHFG